MAKIQKFGPFRLDTDAEMLFFAPNQSRWADAQFCCFGTCWNMRERRFQKMR